MGPDIISSLTKGVFLILFFVFLFLPSYSLSRLLKIEYDDFRSQWEKDGRPYSLPLWIPSDTGIFSFRSNPWFVGYYWLFKTPDWIKGHKAASQALKNYRIISYVEYSLLLCLCLLLMLLTMNR